MFRPPKELVTAPGIRYLEFYGLRLVHSYVFMKCMIFFMAFAPIIAAIVTAALGVMGDFYTFYYLIGGLGGFLLIIAIIMFFIFPGRRTYNHILELRDREAVVELKEILYKPGAKSYLAMLALVDLGEVKPQDLYWRSHGMIPPSNKE